MITQVTLSTETTVRGRSQDRLLLRLAYSYGTTREIADMEQLFKDIAETTQVMDQGTALALDQCDDDNRVHRQLEDFINLYKAPKRNA